MPKKMILLTPDLIRRYAQQLQEQERSAATIQKYVQDLTALAVFLGDRPLTKELAVEWRTELTARGCAPVTVNAKLSALNGLFRFLGREDCRVKFLKVQRQLFREAGRELSRTEYDRLLTAAKSSDRERLALLMETICATGIRVSEVRYITLEAVRRGRAEIALKGKIRVILLPAKLCRKLLAYAEKQKIASGAVFRTRSGKELGRRQIWTELKSLCARAGVAPSKVFPHNLRHLFATIFYKACKDIVRLADILGHSSVETTRIYLLTSGAEHRRQLERLGLIS